MRRSGSSTRGRRLVAASDGLLHELGEAPQALVDVAGVVLRPVAEELALGHGADASELRHPKKALSDRRLVAGWLHAKPPARADLASLVLRVELERPAFVVAVDHAGHGPLPAATPVG